MVKKIFVGKKYKIDFEKLKEVTGGNLEGNIWGISKRSFETFFSKKITKITDEYNSLVIPNVEYDPSKEGKHRVGKFHMTNEDNKTYYFFQELFLAAEEAGKFIEEDFEL